MAKEELERDEKERNNLMSNDIRRGIICNEGLTIRFNTNMIHLGGVGIRC